MNANKLASFLREQAESCPSKGQNLMGRQNIHKYAKVAKTPSVDHLGLIKDNYGKKKRIKTFTDIDLEVTNPYNVH